MDYLIQMAHDMFIEIGWILSSYLSEHHHHPSVVEFASFLPQPEKSHRSSPQSNDNNNLIEEDNDDSLEIDEDKEVSENGCHILGK